MTVLLYVLNVLFSAGSSTVTKQFARKDGDSVIFNINKSAVGAILFLIVGLVGGFTVHLPTVLFGAGYGLFLCCSMYTGFKALATGPMALTSMIASFSLIIPFFFGIFFWNEEISVFKIVGIALLLLSVGLINAKREEGFSLRWLGLALLTLLFNGVFSVLQKLHQIHFPTLYRTEFMFWAFALIFAILTVTKFSSKKQRKISFRFSLLGMTAGILDGLTNYIVLYLSATENASVVFPVVSVAKIMAVWIIGVTVFKERLRPLQVAGLLLGVASIALLMQ